MEDYLQEMADMVGSTLDLEAQLGKVATIVASIVPYKVFAVLLLNEKKQRMHVRFQTGHPDELAERIRIQVGEGIAGQAAASREAILDNDCNGSGVFGPDGAEIRSELAVPLVSRGNLIGVIDLESPEKDFFTARHKRILQLIASRIAVAIENARLYTRASRQAKSLSLLNEIGRDLTSILDLDQLLQHVGDSLYRLIDYQMFGILLLDKSGTMLEHRFAQRFQENVQFKHDVALGEGLVGIAAQQRTPLLVQDVTKDERYIPLNPETRCEMVVPLIYKHRLIGVMDLENTQIAKFSDEHLQTVKTLASQLAVAIENATLYERIARQEQRLEHDLEMAHELQYRLLPSCFPVLRHSEVGARFEPAREIGGDLYDFLRYSSKTTALVIGDVSGKGAPAAIYAALVSGILRSHAPHKHPPAELLQTINRSLASRPIEAQYVSIIYALWDSAQMTLKLANSGLPRPLFCRDGKVTQIDATGLPLGLFPEAHYEELTLPAAPGDVFLLFSDGILDASDTTGQMFGIERLQEVLEQNWRRSASEIVDAIFLAVTEFCGGADAFDDQTVVALRVKDSAASIEQKSHHRSGKKHSTDSGT
jgi:sigma-B regulation protein RsbU (phosphoserine phosphatase)